MREVSWCFRKPVSGYAEEDKRGKEWAEKRSRKGNWGDKRSQERSGDERLEGEVGRRQKQRQRIKRGEDGR